METLLSGELKVRLERYITTKGLNQEMTDTLCNYLLTLHVSESSKETYLQRLNVFGRWLIKNGIKRFTDIKETTINRFLANYDKNNTKNGYLIALKPFYKDFLNMVDIVKDLDYYAEELEPITPSEVLTTDEVIKIAKKAGERRDLYKVITLTVYESCARIDEHLHLKKGDVQFQSVTDNKGKRKLIATLYYKRSKGKVSKQPITLVMFASELKRYVNNLTGDEQSWLFPSPYNEKKPVTKDAVEVVLWNAGTKLGIKKRLNPHWLRHSGLSFFATEMNYNEEALRLRAGWKKGSNMPKRYIHAGHEYEKSSYLKGMRLVESDKEVTVKIMSKTCLHCSSPQPYTNTHCDFCAYPLDPLEYEKVIEKRRNVENLYQNLKKIYSGKLSEGMKAQLSGHTETIIHLAELGRDDLATQYIEKLLETWVKVFLTA